MAKQKLKQAKTEALALMIPIDCVVDSPHNTRQIKKGDKSISQLAESMKEQGQLVPVIVRKKVSKPPVKIQYELLAGKRRLVAAKLAGLTEIRAEVVYVDDAAAIAITVTENLQREDLTPLQEAQQLKVLLEQDKDTKEIAATLGRPVSWVLRRAKLIDLIPEWIKLLEKVEHHWGAVHLELIARYDSAMQKRWYHELYGEYRNFYAGSWTTSELAGELARETRQLKSAQWKLDDPTLLPHVGACTTCEKRSGRQPELFTDDPEKSDAKKDDRCLDPKCWAVKEQKYLRRRLDELKVKHPDLIRIANECYCEEPEILSSYQWVGCQKGAKGAKPAVVAMGVGVGTLRYVKVRSTTQHGGSAGRVKGQPMTMEEKEARLQGRRDAHVLTWLREHIHEHPPKVSHRSVLANLLLHMVAMFGAKEGAPRQDDRAFSPWLDTKQWDFIVEFRAHNTLRKGAIDRVWERIHPILQERLMFHDTASATTKIPEAKRICELLPIDFNDLAKKASEAIPRPKSWDSKPVAKKKPAKKAAARKADKAAKTKTTRKSKKGNK